MSKHRLINLALAALLAAILSLSCLLDGPDDIETMRNVQADLVDAQLMGALNK